MLLNQTVSLYEFGTVGRAFFPGCQTNYFTGEASAAYDPCGNLISLVAQTTGAEVWARAVDKNSTQVIGSYNLYAIEMPYIGDGTVLPPYEEPIVSPIAFTIGKGGFNVKDHIASNTDLTIAIGQNGANVSIYGDDDCGDEICSEYDGIWNLCDKKCFLDCWKRKTATGGQDGKQFMTGNFDKDFNTLIEAYKITARVRGEDIIVKIAEAGFGVAAGAFVADLLAKSGIPLLVKYADLTGVGIAVAVFIDVIIGFAGEKMNKEQLQTFLYDNDMGSSIDKASGIFWSIVSDCIDESPKRNPGNREGQTPGDVPAFYNPIDGNHS